MSCDHNILSHASSLGWWAAYVNPNPNKMTIRQAKVAVFTVERNEENEVVSTKFVKELWVQVKNGGSLDLAVAKELKGDFDPETTVVREIYSLSF
jgi:hypothetical protein